MRATKVRACVVKCRADLVMIALAQLLRVQHHPLPVICLATSCLLPVGDEGDEGNEGNEGDEGNEGALSFLAKSTDAAAVPSMCCAVLRTHTHAHALQRAAAH